VVGSARMTGHRGHIALSAAAALLLAGCGGGTRQDANETAATYSVSVVDASFPKQQKLAKPSEMRIAVKNTGTRRIPTLAVTVDSFARRSQQAGLADAQRPVWIVDQAPRGGTTAYVNTWTLAGLRPGQTRTFRWTVTAVEPGRHQVKWSVGAGLDGKAKTRTGSGDGPATGAFAVDISARPSSARVDPVTGAVIRDGDGGSAAN
jgi:hypothetical protein